MPAATQGAKKAVEDLQGLADESGITMTVEAGGQSATIAPRAGQQLSFDVGGMAPDKSIMKVSGDMLMQCEVRKGEDVHVQVCNADGEVIADGYGRIAALQFKDKTDEEGNVVGCDRIHTAKVS